MCCHGPAPSLVGYSPRGCKESDTTEWLLFPCWKVFQGGTVVKNILAWVTRDVGLIPGLGRSPGMATHYSMLAWKIPWTEELVGYSSLGCKELDLTEHTHPHTPMLKHKHWIQKQNAIQSCAYFYLFFFNFSIAGCSVIKLWRTLWDPIDCRTTGFTVLHYFLEFAQTHIHWVSDAIQTSHLLLSPSPIALSLSQHQGLFQWVSFSH